ncbi:DUF559 domain-containing protein [Georgenia subflava]|uniref:DUF559 domain-containing protein n=1 Tax=Georgenia subflava TaxID=1622177 RepID=UPI00186B2567|nr:DUF559 domain-containing protein [Georgenia subflava]
MREAAEERLRRAAVVGVFTARMASEAGLTRGAIRRKVASGQWVRLVGTAYVDATAPERTVMDPVRQRAIGAALTWPEGVLCLRTAALLHGMPIHDDGHAHVATPVRRRGSRGLVPHLFGLDDNDISRMLSFRVTSRRRTALDCLALLPYGEAERLMAWVRTRDILRLADLSDALTERRGRPGVAQLRHLLVVTRRGALSEVERRVHRILDEAGITGWVANQRIVVGGRVVARADVLITAASVIIEVDGRAAHADFEADRERLNVLTLAGYVVLRFTWRQIVDSPWYVREQIEAALRRAAR